jgi:hypothetical protein
MDNSNKELLVLFDESIHLPKLIYIKQNLKVDRLFKKFIKLCINFNIKLYEIMDDRYVSKSKEKIIKSCYQKRSDIIDRLSKSINNYNQLEKVVLSRKVKILLKNDEQQLKKSDSSSSDLNIQNRESVEETFDVKAGIDKLYLDFKNDSKLLDTLVELIIDHFPPSVIQSFYSSKKYIEEYIS